MRDHHVHRGRISARELLTRGITRENPVFVHLMGLCPALAVTNTVANGLAMALATGFTLVGSSVIVSMLRWAIPKAVRISSYVLIVATFVTAVDLYMQAVVPDVSRSLGAFVYLIVVNCMILGRHEAFSSKHPVGPALLDATGVSVGFLVALVLMGAVRELLGSGSLLGWRVMPEAFEPWVVMTLPPGGFFTIGVLLLVGNWWRSRRRPRDVASRIRRHPNPITAQV